MRISGPAAEGELESLQMTSRNSHHRLSAWGMGLQLKLEGAQQVFGCFLPRGDVWHLPAGAWRSEGDSK